MVEVQDSQWQNWWLNGLAIGNKDVLGCPQGYVIESTVFKWIYGKWRLLTGNAGTSATPSIIFFFKEMLLTYTKNNFSD